MVECKVKGDDNYFHRLKFVPDFYENQKMCQKAVGTIFLQCNLF